MQNIAIQWLIVFTNVLKIECEKAAWAYMIKWLAASELLTSPVCSGPQIRVH